MKRLTDELDEIIAGHERSTRPTTAEEIHIDQKEQRKMAQADAAPKSPIRKPETGNKRNVKQMLTPKLKDEFELMQPYKTKDKEGYAHILEEVIARRDRGERKDKGEW